MSETTTQDPGVDLEGAGTPMPGEDLDAAQDDLDNEDDLTEEERASLEEQRAADPDDEDGTGTPKGEEVPRGKPVSADDQTAMDETTWDDPELEKILSDREVAKGKKGEVIKKFKTLDDLAKDKLTELDIDDGTVLRVGRFRVRKTAVPSRSVAFETEPTSRLTIGVAE